MSTSAVALVFWVHQKLCHISIIHIGRTICILFSVSLFPKDCTAILKLNNLHPSDILGFEGRQNPKRN